MRDLLLVEDGGPMTTLQDRGRFGYQRFGISPAGAMDPDLLSIANALVGNEAGEAALETTLAGPSLVVEADACRVAVAGDQALSVNGEPRPAWTAIDLSRGDRLRLGVVRSGARAYLAVAGGFAVDPVLGSKSTHVRTRTGGFDGGPLRAGQRLELRAARPAGPCLALDPPPSPVSADTPVRVVMGPQDDAFTPAGLATFLGSTWTVSARADRMGFQLDGPVVEHASGFNVVSDGIVAGSIQVPGAGRPIVLLADRQTTGGYTKIATVITADLRLLAAKRPGDAVRFAAVGVVDALAAAQDAHDGLASTLSRIAPVSTGGGGPEAAELLAKNLVGGMVSALADPFSTDQDPATPHR